MRYLLIYSLNTLLYNRLYDGVIPAVSWAVAEPFAENSSTVTCMVDSAGLLSKDILSEEEGGEQNCQKLCL